jgi:putative tryptophan/tyrosine transport system substrate-binding protein
MKMRRWFLALILCLALPGAGLAKSVVVLVSKNLPAYADILAGLGKSLGPDFFQGNMQNDPAAGRSFLAAHAATDLVIVIGPEALACAQQVLPETPLVYTMVFQQPAHHGPSRGVLLQVGIPSQIQRIRDLFPKVRKVGLVYDPLFSAKSVNQAREAAVPLGLEIEALPMQDPKEIGDLLKKMKADKIDVLWSVLDRTTIAPAVVTEEIKFGLSEKIPFIGLSEYHVDAGAFAAFSVDFTSLGKQTARVAAAMLAEGSAAAPEVPDEVVLFINARTQKSLGIANLPALPNVRFKD